MEQHLLEAVSDRVATLTLNRPERSVSPSGAGAPSLRRPRDATCGVPGRALPCLPSCQAFLKDEGRGRKIASNPNCLSHT